jgi:hypothetical protein
MFKLNIRDIVVGCSYWVLELNNTTLNNKILPKKYIYLGKFDEKNEKGYFLFCNNNKLKIPFIKNDSMPIDIYDIGDFIIYANRLKIIQIVKNVAIRPILDETMDNNPSKYIKLLEDITPELLI